MNNMLKINGLAANSYGSFHTHEETSKLNI